MTEQTTDVVQDIDMPYGFVPYYWQIPSYNMLRDGYKRGIWVDHRRSGKDIRGFNLCVEEMWNNPGLYYYVFPSQKQGRKILWEGYTDPDDVGVGHKFVDKFLPKGILCGKPNNTDMKFSIYTKGNKTPSMFQIIGTDQNRYENMRGTNPRGVIFSEQARQHPGAWDVVRPILMKNGGWAIFQSTPNGKNHFKDLYDKAVLNKRWFTCLNTVNDTYNNHNKRMITREQIEEEIRMNMTEDFAQQEFYCSFMQGVEGTYVGRQMSDCELEGRIYDLPYDPSYLVDTYWDIGVADFDAVWFVQQVGKEIRFIDYEEVTGKTWNYWARVLQEKGYLYREHYAPFDIRNREKAGSGDDEIAKSRLQWAADVNINFAITPRASFENGILAIRGILNRASFDEKKTIVGRKHLEQWGRRWNRIEQRYTDFEADSVHTHAGAAGRYTALNIRQAEGYNVGQSSEEKRFKQRFGHNRSGSFMAD